MAENRESKFFYGYIIAIGSFFIMLLLHGINYSFGVFFKPLLAEFSWTRAATSGAYSLSMMLAGFLVIIMGRLTDRFGPRLAITACGFFLGLGCLLMSQIGAIWQLYLFYGVIIGIGMSGSWVPLVSTVARWFVKRRGLMTGVASAGIGAGIMIMPPLATWLISNYDWRTSYTILGIIALEFIILAAQFLKRDPGQVGQLPYGENEVKEQGLSLEARELSFREAIRTRQLGTLFAIYFSYGFWLNSIMVHAVPHATDLGISATSAANILAIIGGGSIGGKMIMGSAGDRIGNMKAFIVSFILVSVALFWLLVAKEVWMLYLFAIVFAFGYAGVATLGSPIVAELFGLGSHGAILGAIVFVYTIGGAVGPIVTGLIFDIIGSYQVAFLACAALAVIGLVLASLLRPTSR